ncbi:AraC family transcriptional regulator [Cupriavidus necator]|uniref:AraC family transcriptional regulator n=1 Tax=Cupriavidus necator TaxID=106590 RepID=A0A367P9X2_CUPNE|nr:AraC family transcriptional regulator [Cupriavidus necator]QQX87612.1 AraC family transcriptional regulator [Cupriavidus necator]RCJ04669.1 AraC family transcriptional regulator [Cupriavidus necator]
MHSVGRLVRSASLAGYIELMESLGLNAGTFLRKVGLSARLLKDPAVLIPSHAMRELLEVTANATGVEDLALRLAARRTLSSLGPISVVLKEEDSPRLALDALCRYLKLISPSLIMQIEEIGRTVVIREDLLPSQGRPTRQAMELAIAMMFRILSELIGPQWRAQQVCFTHRPPAEMSAHRAFFGRNLAFGQPFNGIVCAAADLHKPRTPDKSGATQLARDYLEAALVRRSGGIRETCRELIMALLPGGRCTAQEVARHLRIDRRTLHRHLTGEGMSFSLLLDEVRADLVKRHLQESDLPVGEIAGLLGFSNQSSFSHWFRAAFGCSVTQWRRQAANQSAEAPAAGPKRRRPPAPVVSRK